MTILPVVTPVIGVSLAVQALVAFVQAIAPYKPRPEKIAGYFAAFGSAIPALATIWGIPLYPAAWNVSYIVVGIALAAVAVLPPVAGLLERSFERTSRSLKLVDWSVTY